VTDAKLVADLCGAAGLRHQDPWVRLRVAEALGRMPGPLDGDLLAKAFLACEPSAVELRRMLLWTVERQAKRRGIGGNSAKVYAAGDRIAGSRLDAELRAAALQAMVALDATAAQPTVLAWLEERDRAVRCGAMRALGDWRRDCASSIRARPRRPGDVRARAGDREPRPLASRAAMIALARQLGAEKRERPQVHDPRVPARSVRARARVRAGRVAALGRDDPGSARDRRGPGRAHDDAAGTKARSRA
jgi:hypothetical protein